MKKFYHNCIIALLLTVTALLSCAGPSVMERRPPREEPPRVKPVIPLGKTPIVRVIILETDDKINVKVPAAFFLGESQEEVALKKFDRGGDFVVRTSGRGVRFVDGKGKVIHEAGQIAIRPATDRNIYIKGKPFRGGFLFKPAHSGMITINFLEVDDYIKGVLPAEIGYLSSEQYEAYRAQAIASRSYALSKLKEKETDLYDLKATIMDQVYKGVQGEHPEASNAVDETRGLVAMWNGEPVRAYYSSCCGGHTADIRTSWPWKTPYPYLYGLRDAGGGGKDKSFCRRSPHFRWRVYWSGNNLERILRETLPEELGIRKTAVGKLLDLKVLGNAPDGRITSMEIVTERGTYRVEGDRIRWVLRPNPNSDAILKSTLFKMSVKKARGKVSSVNLVGGGNGHGIGMCQTGAARMAEEGYSADEILEHYYPGIVIYSLYK